MVSLDLKGRQACRQLVSPLTLVPLASSMKQFPRWRCWEVRNQRSVPPDGAERLYLTTLCWIFTKRRWLWQRLSGNRECISTQLLRDWPSAVVNGERRHRQLCQVQVAAVVLVFLRGVQVRWAESAQERSDNCCQLDGRVRRGRSGTSASRVVILWNHGHIQQQVDLFVTLCASEAVAQCIVIGPVCGFVCVFVCGCVCLWVCYHDNSKLRALILTKLGL